MACESCNIGLQNTGVPGKQPIAKVARRQFWVQRVADDGTINEYLKTTVLDAAFLTDRLNDDDVSKRWLLHPALDNVESLRADPVQETLNSGKNLIVQQGTKTFTGVYVKQSPNFIEKAKSAACENMGVITVDICGGLIVMEGSDDTFWAPIAVDTDTLNYTLIDATDTTVQKVQESYEFDSSVQDSEIRYIPCDDLSFDALAANGLLDLIGVDGLAIDNSSYSIQIDTFYGSFINPIKAEGFEAADFELFNVTDTAVVTIITATESTPGLYTFTFAAQPDDVMQTRVTADGFDDVDLRTELVTLPT